MVALCAAPFDASCKGADDATGFSSACTAKNGMLANSTASSSRQNSRTTDLISEVFDLSRIFISYSTMTGILHCKYLASYYSEVKCFEMENS